MSRGRKPSPVYLLNPLGHNGQKSQHHRALVNSGHCDLACPVQYEEQPSREKDDSGQCGHCGIEARAVTTAKGFPRGAHHRMGDEAPSEQRAQGPGWEGTMRSSAAWPQIRIEDAQ